MKKDIDILKELDELIAAKKLNSKELIKAAFLTLSLEDISQQYNYLVKVSETFKEIKLSQGESNQVLEKCVHIYQFAFLFNKPIYNVAAQQKLVRYLVANLIETKPNYDLLLISNMMNAKTQEELTPLTVFAQYTIDLLLELAEDSFFFPQIFHIMLKSLCLTANIKTIGTDRQIQRIAQRIVTTVETKQDLYFWQTLMETIVHAGNYQFLPDALIQPAVVGRVLLSKISCISDVYKYLGKYLVWSIGIEFQFMKSYISMGPSFQALTFIYSYLTDVFRVMPVESAQKNEVALRQVLSPENVRKLINLLMDYLQIKFVQNYRLILQIILLVINQAKFEDQKVLSNLDQFFNAQYEKQQLREIADFYDRLPQYATECLPLLTKRFKRPFTQYRLSTSNQGPEKCIGMKNLFNTCYLNSFLQALSLTQKFIYVVQQFPVDKLDFFTKEQTLKNTIINWAKFMNCMQFKVEYSPIQLKRSLREPYRTELSQQDAGEFGAHLFDDLEKSMKPDEYQRIKEIFVGKQQARLECCKCNKPTEGPLEEFIQLSVNITPSNSTYPKTTIRQLLDKYFDSETLGYKCDHCQLLSENQKSIKLKETPQCLIIQLNRFQYKNNMRVKVNEMIEVLDRIVIDKCHYTIYAVITHFGITAEAGHYLVYGKKDDSWYRFDDSDVCQVGQYDQVQSLFSKENTPYLLFYQKQYQA